MALSWNEIKSRAIEFSKEWENDFNEHAEAKSFMDAFFNVFGIPRRRVATFEEFVRNEAGKQGFIDLLWKGHISRQRSRKGTPKISRNWVEILLSDSPRSGRQA